MFELIERAMDRAPEPDEVQDALEATPFMGEYRKKIGLIAASIGLAFLCQSIFYVAAKKMTPPQLLFIAANGQQQAMTAMSLPNQSKDAVKDWAREAIQKSYTFDFVDVEKAMQSAEPYFTLDAWPVFQKAMLNSGMVKQVKKNKLLVSVVAQGDPIIESSASERGSGEFAWKLIVPVTMSYSGDAPTKTEDMVIRITVIRVPTTENPKGLGVLQMSAGPMS